MYLGLDVSKNTLDCCLNKDGFFYACKISNNQKGFEKLKVWLDGHGCDETLHCCCEATGNYYEAAAEYLAVHYKMSVENPRKIKAYAVSELKRSKNDKQDAKTIAEFCEEKSRKLKAWKPKNQTEKELQSITRYIARLKQQKASETVKRQTASDNIKDLIDETIDYLGSKIKEAEGRLKTYISQNPELKQKAANLTTIPGIGIQTAAIIMAALSGNNDFKTAKQFTAYLGLDPAEYKSGTSVKGKDRISKVGDCMTRAALFSPALVAYRIGTFPRLVANMRQNGKHIMQILTAIMRKLAVVAYTLHKTNTTFEKQRHTRIQQKAA